MTALRDPAAWVTWALARMEAHRKGREMPGVSKPITEDEADALCRAWRGRRGK